MSVVCRRATAGADAQHQSDVMDSADADTAAPDEAPTPDPAATSSAAAGRSTQTCQWISSEHRPWMFCGRPVLRPGCAWCEEHWRRVYIVSRRDRYDRDTSDEDLSPRRREVLPV